MLKTSDSEKSDVKTSSVNEKPFRSSQKQDIEESTGDVEVKKSTINVSARIYDSSSEDEFALENLVTRVSRPQKASTPPPPKIIYQDVKKRKCEDDNSEYGGMFAPHQNYNKVPKSEVDDDLNFCGHSLSPIDLNNLPSQFDYATDYSDNDSEGSGFDINADAYNSDDDYIDDISSTSSEIGTSFYNSFW